MDGCTDSAASKAFYANGSWVVPWWEIPPWTAKGPPESGEVAPLIWDDTSRDSISVQDLGETRRADPQSVREAIEMICDELKAFLVGKNASYGNSAFEPIGVFSKLPAREGVLLRIDDKLKRIRNGGAYPGDDNIKDLAGYLILLMVMETIDNV